MHQNYPKCCSERELRHFWLFREKIFFLKFPNFFNFFAGPGSGNFSKMTKSSFSLYEPKIHQNYPKCCSELELRLFWVFREKQIFLKFPNVLNFLAGPGSGNISKMTKSSFSLYEPKINKTTQNVVQNVN